MVFIKELVVYNFNKGALGFSKSYSFFLVNMGLFSERKSNGNLYV